MSQQTVSVTKVDAANEAIVRPHPVPERAKRMTAVAGFSLEPHGITVADVRRNLSPPALYEDAIRHELAHLDRRQRRPGRLFRREDRPFAQRQADRPPACLGGGHLVGAGEFPSGAAFKINRERAKDYLDTRERLYVVDGFAGWDPKYRTQNPRDLLPGLSRAVHAQHADPAHEGAARGLRRARLRDLQRRPVPRQPLHHGDVVQDQRRPQLRTIAKWCFLGTEYAGEMKKGVFTIMNYLMPKQGVLSMHCSATADRRPGDRRSCSACRGPARRRCPADPKRLLIGDDEHCWTDARRLQHRGGLLRQDDRPGPEGIRARHLPGAAVRLGAGECRPRRRPTATSTLRRRQHHGEHARRLPDRVHAATPEFPASPGTRPTSSF